MAITRSNPPPPPPPSSIMMTSSNGNIFRVTGPLCWEFTGHRLVPPPPQMPVTRSFDVFFDLRLNKRLSNQSRCRWFETPLCSLWRHCNDIDKAGWTSYCLLRGSLLFIWATSISRKCKWYKYYSMFLGIIKYHGGHPGHSKLYIMEYQ